MVEKGLLLNSYRHTLGKLPAGDWSVQSFTHLLAPPGTVRNSFAYLWLMELESFSSADL